MNILTLPLRNLSRRPLRAGLLAGVFALGLTAVIALGYVSGRVGESLEQRLLAFGANILVAPRTDTLTVSYGGFRLGDLSFGEHALRLDEVDKAVNAIGLRERISTVAPKLVRLAEIQGGDAGPVSVGLVGVRWSDETRLKGFWAVDGVLPARPGELLAGSRVARQLKLRPGSRLRLLDADWIVSGVLHATGSDDDKVLFADLAELQRRVGAPGRVSFVELAALCSGCPIDEIVAQIAEALPGTEVTALKNVVKQRMSSVEFVQRLALVVSLVILLVACAMLGLTMLAAVHERRREIGILRSLGYARSEVFAIFSAEALFLGFGAGIVGYCGGWLVARQVLAVLEDTGSGALPFQPGHLALVTLAAALIAAVSAALPAAKAARVRPWDALTAH